MAAEREIKVRETAFADMASAVDELRQQAGIDFVNEKIMIDGIYEATVYLDNRQITTSTNFADLLPQRLTT